MSFFRFNKTAFAGVILTYACSPSNQNAAVDSTAGEQNLGFGLAIRNGKIELEPDPNGNMLPDFSYVGYKDGLEPIPDIPTTVTVDPGDGDDGARIQAAIDQVSAMPLNNGFRGAVLLKKGNYEVSGSLRIAASGVVLRGSGSGPTDTVIHATGDKNQKKVIDISGSGEAKLIQGSDVRLTEKYIPFGHRSFQVSSAAPFKVGDNVIIRWQATQKFISAIGMDKIAGGKSWEQFKIEYERTIKNICGNTIVIDAPLVQAIDQSLTVGTLFKYSSNGRISGVGVENIRFVSKYQKGKKNSDENHAESAIVVDKAEHGWVRNIEAYHFIYAAVWVAKDAKNFTVSLSKNLDPVSKIDGKKRYSFKIDGARNLFERNQAQYGRHDFVTGARVAGPNVFLNSKSTNAYNNVGPHLRWATGTLYDNITAGKIDVQDRGDLGESGQGWTGAQHVFWNCRADSMVCEDPPTARNFSFGFIGKRNLGLFGANRKICHWQSPGKRMSIASLYDYQLAERKKGGDRRYTCAAAEREMAVRRAPEQGLFKMENTPQQSENSLATDNPINSGTIPPSSSGSTTSCKQFPRTPVNAGGGRCGDECVRQLKSAAQSIGLRVPSNLSDAAASRNFYKKIRVKGKLRGCDPLEGTSYK
ncbi:MAG: hypothetical protein RI932_303 [Pseudomonadota bacterium]